MLSNDRIIEKLEKNIELLAGLYIIGTAVLAALYYKFSYYGDCWISFIGWISILFLIAAGKKCLNKETGFTRYFNKASYPIYILHQTILVVLAYYVVRICDVIFIQVCCICIGSFLLTILAYHLISILPGVRKLAGIK